MYLFIMLLDCLHFDGSWEWYHKNMQAKSSAFLWETFSIIMYQKCSFMEKVIINLKHIHMHNHMHTEHNLDLLQVDLTSFYMSGASFL